MTSRAEAGKIARELDKLSRAKAHLAVIHDTLKHLKSFRASKLADTIAAMEQELIELCCDEVYNKAAAALWVSSDRMCQMRDDE